MTANPANDNHATRVLAGFAPCVPAQLQELFAAHYAPEGFREQVLLLTRGAHRRSHPDESPCRLRVLWDCA